MSKKNSKLPKHLTKGGPGDQFLGNGKVDTSKWFENIDILENQIKNQEIWFCSAPFQMIYTNVHGELLPCSWAQEGIGPNIKNRKIKDYFKDDILLYQLRKEMTTPGSDLQTVERVCKNCRVQESQYGRSRRQASLKIQTNDSRLWPGIRNAVEKFKLYGKGAIEERILEVQVKAFGNQCNLDCYMCIPHDSSTRLETIHSEDLSKENIFSNAQKQHVKSINSQLTDNIIEQIVELAPYIYNLKFIGGEPLVMKQFYQLLERILITGHAKDIQVKYQTNMSVLNFEKIKLTKFIPEFALFEFTVSLDSIGIANDYIRRRSNWNEIVKNINIVSNYSNVKINVNGAISFLSVLRFYELIDWFDKNSNLFDQINWSNIRFPKKLCANVLPDKLKEILIPKYERFSDIQNLLKESNNGLDYQDTLNYLLMIDKRYKNTKWEMHLFDVFPELKEFYKG